MAQQMKTIKLAILFIVVCSGNLLSQDETVEEFKPDFGVSILPQYAFVGTLKLEFDKRIGNTQNWIVISPSYTSSENDKAWSFSYDRKVGAGLNISHRYYMSNLEERYLLYLQYGLTYNFTRLEYEGAFWINSDFDGIDVITASFENIHDTHHKYGGDFIVGWSTTELGMEKFLLDIYIGVGFRESSSTTTGENIQTNKGDGILSPSFRGILPLAGIRYGITF